MKLSNLTLGALLVGLVSMPALASGKGNTECPVGLVSGQTLDDEFGPGTADLTKCIKKRHQVKMLVQINQFCTAPATPESCATSPYALNNIKNIIDDYEITHGMVRGRDYEIVAVIHSGGGRMALKDTGARGDGTTVPGRNPFQGTVQDLMDKGVKFYFCQNTTRSFIKNGTLPTVDEAEGGATEQLIDGVEYVTAGVTAISDLQEQGYRYVQP